MEKALHNAQALMGATQRVTNQVSATMDMQASIAGKHRPCHPQAQTSTLPNGWSYPARCQHANSTCGILTDEYYSQHPHLAEKIVNTEMKICNSCSIDEQDP